MQLFELLTIFITVEWKMSLALRSLFATIIAIAPTTLLAETFTLDCTRNRVDTSAYTDAAAADSWHPRQATLRIDNDDVYFGDMRGEVRREGTRYKFDFVVVSQGNAAGAPFNATVTYIPRTGIYTLNITPPGGYAIGAGSGGNCVRR
jgi:hypothetical protein